MRLGVSIACQLMPELAGRIRTLADEDDSFLELCEDLAVAQQALEGLTSLPQVLRKHRLAEAEGWIVGLCAEIKAAVTRPARRPRV
jgi:hypothetical protein